MLLEIAHRTRFRYTAPVGGSHMELRLTPMTDGGQHLLQHRRRVEPARPIREYLDFQGNLVSCVSIPQAHEHLEVEFESLVETYPAHYRGLRQAEPARPTPAERLALFDFLRPTPLTHPGPEFREWIRDWESLRGGPVPVAAEVLREAIHTGFRYDGDTTSATSTVADLLCEGAGVCQDFTHLMVTAARHLGIAARYVSGYVVTDSTQAQAVESHAWCEVYDPEAGWFGVDPTHNDWVDENHVRLAVGRDFRDAAPNRGVWRGDADEQLEVRLRLRPLTREAMETRLLQLKSQPWTQRIPRLAPRRSAPPSILEQTLHWQQQQQQQS